MTFYDQKFNLSDPKFLLYFLPRCLKKESIFTVKLRSSGNKNLEFEVMGLNIMSSQQSVNFLKCFENKFYLYKNTPFSFNQEFSLSFKSLDFQTETFNFTNNKRSKYVGKYNVPFFLEKHHFLNLSPRDSLVKSRVFGLSKGGFISSCFGNPAFIVRSSSFYKFCKYKCYQNWFSLNLQYYGILSYFVLVSFNRFADSYSKNYKKQYFFRRVLFYFFKNESVRYFFLLAKPMLKKK